MFGQGRIVPTLQLGFHPHNSYVGALFLHGIGGVVWLFVLFGLLGRRAWWLSRNAADPLRSVASGVGWGTMVWAIAGLTQDMIVTPLPRFVYLLFIVLIDRGYAIAPRPPFVEAPAPFMRPGAFRAIQAAERHGRPERVGT
jgi:O-antigen ligase